jgi:hypothetical protein
MSPRPCLIEYKTIQHCSCIFFSSFFYIFHHQSTSKHFHFFTFYITSIIFYSLQSKTFSLFYTFFKIFISHHHFLQILKLTTHYSVMFCSVQFFAKQAHIRKNRWQTIIESYNDTMNYSESLSNKEHDSSNIFLHN